ncbi:MAG TPA: hypothetical protein VNI57_01280 [Candidatus Saccharimonadales bacterium]|nr:hypothetical protein [Candidatus Saccharimonadales bacterium]
MTDSARHGGSVELRAVDRARLHATFHEAFAGSAGFAHCLDQFEMIRAL